MLSQAHRRWILVSLSLFCIAAMIGAGATTQDQQASGATGSPTFETPRPKDTPYRLFPALLKTQPSQDRSRKPAYGPRSPAAIEA